MMIIGHVDRELEDAANPYVIYRLENQKPEDMADILDKIVNATQGRNARSAATARDPKVQAPSAGGGTLRGVGFSIGDKGYIGTGVDRLGRSHDYFWEYDSINDTWDVKEPIGVIGRSLAIGFSIGNK